MGSELCIRDSVQHAGEQKAFSEADIPPRIRELMDHGHDDKDNHKDDKDDHAKPKSN